MCCKNSKNQWTSNYVSAPQKIEYGFPIVKNHGREVIIYLQIFETHSIQSLLLKVIIKSQKTLT